MLTVETIRKIRLSVHRDGKSIRQTAEDLRLSRNTVRKAIRTGERRFITNGESIPWRSLARMWRFLKGGWRRSKSFQRESAGPRTGVGPSYPVDIRELSSKKLVFSSLRRSFLCSKITRKIPGISEAPSCHRVLSPQAGSPCRRDILGRKKKRGYPKQMITS